MVRHSTYRRKQSGFSLLESTASILLLAGVAAVALPKLEALEVEAKKNGHQYVIAAEERAAEVAQLQQKHF